MLHRVSMGGEGHPIDSTHTDASGRYVLRVAATDSTALYVVSSWYAGIAYFSEPVVPSQQTAAQLHALYVYDTSSAGPAVELARRVVTVARSKRDGSRDILELLELENPGRTTRVAPDSTRPAWAGSVPAAALQFQVGQGDVSPQTVTLRGDSVAVFGPLPPRERKQLSYTYVLPATAHELRLPIDQPTAELDLLLEDTTAVVRAAQLESLRIETIGGRRFARYRAASVAAGAPFVIAFRETRFVPESLVPLVVSVAALVLAAGLVVALRRRPLVARASPPPARP
ncbi:MAG TPA: hypothetical protein VM736_11360 [Gemmatimonadales bacterium]|nr:hypothetical protein [Gemmatimonadales bacterium]